MSGKCINTKKVLMSIFFVLFNYYLCTVCAIPQYLQSDVIFNGTTKLFEMSYQY